MDVLTLILACSLHPDDELVRVLIDVASQKNTYFVGDAKDLKTYDRATSVEESRKIVAEILRHSGRPALGLMGVPIAWAGRFSRTPDDLFDACTNVSIATAMLSQFSDQCRAERSPRRRGRARGKAPRISAEALRPCILRRFGDELGIFSFVDGVTKAIAEDRARALGQERDAAERSPVFVDGSDESDARDLGWSSQRLFAQPSDSVQITRPAQTHPEAKP
jgi:hypothetical protein